jgi:hypothetical protein
MPAADADWLRTVPRCPLRESYVEGEARNAKKESSRDRLPVTVRRTQHHHETSKGRLHLQETNARYHQLLSLLSLYHGATWIKSWRCGCVCVSCFNPDPFLSFLDDNRSWNDDHGVSQARKTHKMFCLRRYVVVSSVRLLRSKANK